MTDKQDKFIEEYVRTGNATQSAIYAGYAEKNANVQGHQLKKKFRTEIEDATYKSLQDKIPQALSWVTNLAQNAESESVRLGAIKDILDRAGLKPVEKIETTTIESMSDEEIQRELDVLRTRH
jgi:phage terminase small subunit